MGGLLTKVSHAALQHEFLTSIVHCIYSDRIRTVKLQ